MAVCQGCGTEEHSLHRQQVAALQRIAAELNVLDVLDPVAVEIVLDHIYVPGVAEILYDTQTRMYHVSSL